MIRASAKSRMAQLDSQLSWDWLPEIACWTVEQALAIQQIPAPTFQEQRRSAWIASLFHAVGLQDVLIDELHNVFGRLPGSDVDAQGLMFSAHVDTIFQESIDLSIKHGENCIYGPGLGDNSIGVAGLLGLVRSLQKLAITPTRDLWFTATTREEGLGDLGGMRAAYARLKDDIDAVINIEGLALGHIYHAGIAVRRLHISVECAGGHSWLHFGRPSATHALIKLGALLCQMQLGQSPRTTYNIGMIEGGEAINAIATRASLWLDLRSEDSDALAALEMRVRNYVTMLSDDETQFTVAVVGDRPAGMLAADHVLVENALAALEQVGITGSLETGSTDGNIPLAEGCPAVTVGITRGGNAHRLDEFIETRPVAQGLRQLTLLTLAMMNASSLGE